jgi:hypothetical protein
MGHSESVILNMPNVRCSWLNSKVGPVGVKTYTLHKWYLHHSAFNLIVYYLTVSLFAKILCSEFLKKLYSCLLYFLYWVVKLTIFSLQSFQMTLYIIVMKIGILVGLVMVNDLNVWPYEWDIWIHCSVSFFISSSFGTQILFWYLSNQSAVIYKPNSSLIFSFKRVVSSSYS